MRAEARQPIRQVWLSLDQADAQQVVDQFRRAIKEMIDEHFRISSATASDRQGEIYVRQSSPNQVITNKESQRMQYALRERATTLGWHEQDIAVSLMPIWVAVVRRPMDAKAFRNSSRRSHWAKSAILLAFDATRLGTQLFPLVSAAGPLRTS